MSIPRTYLYVPGNQPAKLARAGERGADALIIDLEDAVPLSEKDAALNGVLSWLSERHADAGIELWVRLNSGSRRLDEATALSDHPALTGLVMAKTEEAREIADVAAAAGSLLLMPMIETPGAVLDARSLAAGPQVRQLQIGEVDLSAETGLDVSPDESELGPYRALVVLGSRAAGIEPPPGPVSREVRDLDAFAASSRRLFRQGFHGRVCIHPAQVSVVHELLTPIPEAVEEARTILDLLAKAEALGSGVVLDSDGRLVDLAVVRQARRILELAEHNPPPH